MRSQSKDEKIDRFCFLAAENGIKSINPKKIKMQKELLECTPRINKKRPKTIDKK